MRLLVTIPSALEQQLREHLFQDDLEQAAFLFARPEVTAEEIRLDAVSAYLVPVSGWYAQGELYLEMTDTERARIMKQARGGGYAVIDCHSHRGFGGEAWFSPSDIQGTTEFAAYVKWKLDGKPYLATVWGESSLDAVGWYGDFHAPVPVEEIRILGNTVRVITPRGTWFQRASSRPKKGWLR